MRGALSLRTFGALLFGVVGCVSVSELVMHRNLGRGLVLLRGLAKRAKLV